eukprot:2707650-Amphidinium_carterae.3
MQRGPKHCHQRQAKIPQRRFVKHGLSKSSDSNLRALSALVLAMSLLRPALPSCAQRMGPPHKSENEYASHSDGSWTVKSARNGEMIAIDIPSREGQMVGILILDHHPQRTRINRTFQ